MTDQRDFSRRYRAAQRDFADEAARMAAARAEVDANRARLHRETRNFFRILIGATAIVVLIIVFATVHGLPVLR